MTTLNSPNSRVRLWYPLGPREMQNHQRQTVRVTMRLLYQAHRSTRGEFLFDSTVEQTVGSWAFDSLTFWDFEGDLLGSGLFSWDSVSRAELAYAGPLEWKKAGRASLQSKCDCWEPTLAEMVMPSSFAMVAVHAGIQNFQTDSLYKDGHERKPCCDGWGTNAFNIQTVI